MVVFIILFVDEEVLFVWVKFQIVVVVQVGIVIGYGDNIFKFDCIIICVEMVVMMVKVLKLSDVQVGMNGEIVKLSFIDVV